MTTLVGKVYIFFKYRYIYLIYKREFNKVSISFDLLTVKHKVQSFHYLHGDLDAEEKKFGEICGNQK